MVLSSLKSGNLKFFKKRTACVPIIKVTTKVNKEVSVEQREGILYFVLICYCKFWACWLLTPKHRDEKVRLLPPTTLTLQSILYIRKFKSYETRLWIILFPVSMFVNFPQTHFCSCVTTYHWSLSLLLLRLRANSMFALSALNECSRYLLRRKSQPSGVCAPTTYTAVFTSAGKLQQVEYQVTLHVVFQNTGRNTTVSPSHVD